MQTFLCKMWNKKHLIHTVRYNYYFAYLANLHPSYVYLMWSQLIIQPCYLHLIANKHLYSCYLKKEIKHS